MPRGPNPILKPLNDSIPYLVEDQECMKYRQLLRQILNNPHAESSRFAASFIHEHIEEFMPACLMIITRARQRIPFQLKRCQKRLLDRIHEQEQKKLPIRIIILKARQLGISTFIAGWNFTMAITNPYIRACVMADLKSKGQNIFSMYERFYKYLPFEIRPEVESKILRSSIDFIEPLGSSIRMFVAEESSGEEVGSTGRSETLHQLHLSEFAFFRNPRATLNALLECVPYLSSTAVFIESTAHSYGDDFHAEWTRAESGDSDYLPFFVPWFLDDGEYRLGFDSEIERDEFRNSINIRPKDQYGDERALLEAYPDDITLEHLKWRRMKIRQKAGDIRLFEIEYPSTPSEAFQVAGGKWLRPIIMEIYRNAVRKPVMIGDFKPAEQLTQLPIFESRVDGYVKIWTPPDPYCEYIIGTDSAEGGEGRDFSAGEVYRRMPEGVVAEIRASDDREITQTEFAWQVYYAALYFNQAWVNPESNFGQVVKSVLEDTCHYPRLVRSKQLRIGSQRFTYNDEKVGWWMCRSVSEFMRVYAKEWFEGTVGQFTALAREHFEMKDCPNIGLLNEACQAEFSLGTRHIHAPRKHLPRRPGEDEIGHYDDRLYAFFGCLLADVALPPPVNPILREDMMEMSRIKVEGEELFSGFPGAKKNNHIGGVIPKQWLQGGVRLTL